MVVSGPVCQGGSLSLRHSWRETMATVSPRGSASERRIPSSLHRRLRWIPVRGLWKIQTHRDLSRPGPVRPPAARAALAARAQDRLPGTNGAGGPRGGRRADGIALADLFAPWLALGRGRRCSFSSLQGIPHLYPAPHPAIPRRDGAGVPVDNGRWAFSCGRCALSDWHEMDRPPRIVAITAPTASRTTFARCYITY